MIGKKIWDSLEQKGKYATIIGLVIAIITTGFIVIAKIKGRLPDEAVIYYVLYGISMAFFILPSSLLFEIPGKFKTEIKD